MYIPLPPPRRRGKHAKPSKSAHAVPAVLLAMPVVSGAGLASLGDSARADAGLTSRASAAAASRVAPSSSAPGPAAAQRRPSQTAAPRTQAVNEQNVRPPRVVSPPARVTAPAKAVVVTPPPRRAPVVVQASRRAPERASRSSRRTAWVAPLAGRLTSSYGPRWGRQHGGIDVAAPTGVPIRAAAAGEVILAGWGGGYGNLVRIRHADGTISAYAHMSRILVKGSYVRAGEVIGKVGSTGRSTGPHLHFEVRVADRPINPVTYLRGRGVAL